MNKGLTEIVFLLDRSGSMSGLEKDTIGGYNSFLKSQKELGDNVIITTILFDDKYEILYNGVDIERATLNNENYYVRGTTALLDAIGKSILLVKERYYNINKFEGKEVKSIEHKALKNIEDEGLKNIEKNKVIFVITTDGMENSSNEFSRKNIKDLISQQEESGWEFLFFGANIDVEEEGDSLGIKESSRFEFNATSDGYLSMMEELNCVVREIRKDSYN